MTLPLKGLNELKNLNKLKISQKILDLYILGYIL